MDARKKRRRIIEGIELLDRHEADDVRVAENIEDCAYVLVGQAAEQQPARVKCR